METKETFHRDLLKISWKHTQPNTEQWIEAGIECRTKIDLFAFTNTRNEKWSKMDTAFREGIHE